MALLVFADTETTSLNYNHTDEIWMIHCKAAFTGHRMHHDEFTRLIEVDQEKILQLPEKFQKIYHDTWDNPKYAELKRTDEDAALDLIEWFGRAGPEKINFIAANVRFDVEMITQCLVPPEMFFSMVDYHTIDIEAFTLGWLRAQETRSHEIISAFVEGAELMIRESFLPFKSDDLTRMLGVEDETEHKHDSESDVNWMIRMWLKMNGGKF
jgi:hypothetical protein